MSDSENVNVGASIFILAFFFILMIILINTCDFSGGNHSSLPSKGTFAEESTIGCRAKDDLYEFYDGATANDVQQLYTLVAEGYCYLLVGQSWSKINDLGSISEVRVYFPQGSKRLFVASSYMR